MKKRYTLQTYFQCVFIDKILALRKEYTKRTQMNERVVWEKKHEKGQSITSRLREEIKIMFDC